MSFFSPHQQIILLTIAHTAYQRFDDEVAKLGLRGITVVVASGDDGVANFQARDDPSKCGTLRFDSLYIHIQYSLDVGAGHSTSFHILWLIAHYISPLCGLGFHPSFPASAPHVVAVGATMGPESGSSEIACTSANGGLITTGYGSFHYVMPCAKHLLFVSGCVCALRACSGGFSTGFSQPSYQSDAVSAYMSSGVRLPPSSMYKSHGRGYPDVGCVWRCCRCLSVCVVCFHLLIACVVYVCLCLCE